MTNKALIRRLQISCLGLDPIDPLRLLVDDVIEALREHAMYEVQRLGQEIEQEAVGFAGIEMWIGNTRIKKLMTQAELHFAIDPWAIVKFHSDSCMDALKEKNNG